MHSIQELIKEASALPVEARAHIVDSLMRTLNPPDNNIEAQWITVAEQRLADLNSGKVKPVSGADIFERIAQRFFARDFSPPALKKSELNPR